MKVLIPLMFGLLLAVGVVKLSRTPDTPGGNATLRPGLVAQGVIGGPNAFGSTLSGETRTTMLGKGLLSWVDAGLGQGELGASRDALWSKFPEESDRRRAFDALMQAQLGTSRTSLDDLEALLRGSSLDEEHLSNGVLMPLGATGEPDDSALLEELGLTRGECAALANEAVAKRWF